MFAWFQSIADFLFRYSGDFLALQNKKPIKNTLAGKKKVKKMNGSQTNPETQPNGYNEKLLLMQFVQSTRAIYVGKLGGMMLFRLGGAIFTEKEIILARERFVNFSREKPQQQEASQPLEAAPAELQPEKQENDSLLAVESAR